MPDDIVPTASGKTMKSGYGVKTEVRATLSTDAPTSHITYPQTAFSVFPEFQYQTYLRLLQRSGGQSAKFIFKPNEFSTYDRTVHFTPLWFPDATDYTIYTQVWDTWTPDGMLSINLNDYVSIQGSLMMTGIPIENNLWTAYLLTIFFVVAGFAVYDVLYRRCLTGHSSFLSP